jgi:hypothetical protein
MEKASVSARRAQGRATLSFGRVRMAGHLVIDGYNLIRRSGSLRREEDVALELGREELLEQLRRYKRARGQKITVVFDAGAKAELGEACGHKKGIRVIYSAQGETADATIKRICRREGEGLIVVTSDRELAAYAERCGAVTMASESFEDKLEMALFAEVKGVDENDLEEEESRKRGAGKGIRKKGPGRKPSRDERRKRRRLDKL